MAAAKNKEGENVRVSKAILSKVRDHIRNSGQSITCFYDIAAEQALAGIKDDAASLRATLNAILQVARTGKGHGYEAIVGIINDIKSN